MTAKTRLRKSEAQANAEALERRAAPFAAATSSSIERAWDFRRREPRSLKEAVYYVRRAYADEVPEKLHDGPDAIGPDGTPRMAARAEGYLFGSAAASDATIDPETGQPAGFLSFYHAPFRAALERMLQHATEGMRRRGRIVSHVTIGSMDPIPAALQEGAHWLDAKLVAEDALRTFLASLTDVKVHPVDGDRLHQETTAA